MSETVKPLPGNLLSTVEATSARAVLQIYVEILPVQHPGHLEVFADNFGAGWLDPEKKQLRLQFHLVAIFSNAKTEELWLSVPGKDEKIAVHPACVASPGVGQRYPELLWSAQSRLIVDEVIELPDCAISTSKFELSASVAGKPEKVGIIHISEALKTSDAQAGSARVPAAKPQIASEATQKIAPTKNNISQLVCGVIERIKSMNRLLLLTVVLPTLISSIYFGLIASDVYISESRFVVRSPERQASSGLGALLQGTGFSRSQDDTYTVHDFIFSRDALKQLDDQLAVSKEFAGSKIDIFSRFSGLDRDKSFEALYRYYQKHVTVDLDSLSSISTLSVSAFTPESAYHINKKLLEMSENLVNQLNERGRQDVLDYAKREVFEAAKKSKEATLALARIQTGGAKMNERNDALVTRLSEFQRLTLEKEFADKMLAMAMNSLEQARNDAQRKQLYLERIVEPGKPDIAIEPRRIRNVFATFILGLIAWGILTMLLAGIREHQD